ncbi:site-specific recombinase XerD [Lipingzhangella halophila]|uniref:Site-specific recombinase XerD n=1 Tax=Lipingzhangella halophila TaxID=1783352 RepID=A0A7W7RNV1_9ACTN|nr:tyrosine-type recombinase/integrase [Lipingzhangella halophila]MBB4935462.1 site-specific recombinase XerD [Lipingzhangella halophila]
MGYVTRRVRKNDRIRYTAIYLDIKGKARSAGTFDSEREAEKAWQRAESKVAEGRVTSTKHGRQRFAEYALDTWLDNHVMEESTRQNVSYVINAHLVPEFGRMRMNEILPQHIQSWVRDCEKEGLAASSIHRMTTILSAVFASAMVNQVTFINPCKGVTLPTIGKRKFDILTPEQFSDFLNEIEGERFKLMVELDIESGLRWGELSELRLKDLDRDTGILTVSRSMVELRRKDHPTEDRFLVKDYTKNGNFRRFKLTRSLVRKILAFAMANGIRENDLLFNFPEQLPESPVPGVPDRADLGLTAPNDKGRRYRHGTTTAYTNGKCRCEYCRAAFAHYRATRRAEGKDNPRKRRSVHTDGHIPANWFRKNIWHPARERAGLPKTMTPHQLRHAHASWLLAGGADLAVVRDRLGHASVTTTELYLHTLPEADDTALEALVNIRERGGRKQSNVS